MTRRQEQEFSAEVGGSAADCFATLIDFEAYPSWSGPIQATKVLARSPDKLPLQVQIELDIKLRTIHYVLQYTYEKPRRVVWHMVDGDLEYIEGSYDFDKMGPKRTRATCRQTVSLGFWLPGAVRSVLEKQALRQSVLDFKAEVERRNAAKKKRVRAKRKA